MTRRSTMGRTSDFGLEIPPDMEDQTTVFLSEPALDTGSQAVDDATRGSLTTVGDDVLEPADDFSDREPMGDFGDFGDDASSAGSAGEGSAEGGLPAGPDEFSGGRSEIGEVTATLTTTRQPAQDIESRAADTRVLKKRKLVSQHGIEYPSLPASFVKRVAQTALQSSGLSNKRVSTDTLAALTQASEWYFEQLGDDLGAYANHAKRKTIEDSDVAMLMKR